MDGEFCVRTATAENHDAVITARDELNKNLSEKMGCQTKTGLIDKDNKVFDMDI